MSIHSISFVYIHQCSLTRCVLRKHRAPASLVPGEEEGKLQVRVYVCTYVCVYVYLEESIRGSHYAKGAAIEPFD